MPMCLTNGHTEIIMIKSQEIAILRFLTKSGLLQIKERKVAVMDSGSTYHIETEGGRKRIPALHL